MNAKKLVMLLAVVAIAVGVYFMMNKKADECECCMTPSTGDETVMVMDENCNCNDCDEGGDEEEGGEEEKQEISLHIGTFDGTCPPYNMKNKYGEDMVIGGKKIPMPAIKHRYTIYDNNICSITMDAEGTIYSCDNVSYNVSYSNDDFSLTMNPKSGSACGGNPITLVKEGDSFFISGDDYSNSGQPKFSVDKIK